MNYCILVNSCDAYEEAWDPFFALLTKYWGPKLPKIYLNTESIDYKKYNVRTIHSNKEKWSSRLLDCLNSINEKYVLMMLDDFFIMKKVNTFELDNALSILENDQMIGGIYFKKIYKQKGPIYKRSRYYIMDDTVEKYYLNFQASLFKKDVLKQMIVPNRSPWEIEESNIFNQVGFKLLCDSRGNYLNCNEDVIPYLWSIESGYGICKSKWLWNNQKLFRKNGISVKYKRLKKYTHIRFLLDKGLSRLASKNFVHKIVKK